MKRIPRWSGAAAVLLAAAALAVVYRFAGGLCFFRLLTGIPCPACGMTRAVTSVLRGEIALAFSYHPLWITLPLIALLGWASVHPQSFSRLLDRIGISRKRWQRAEVILCVLLLAAFLIVYLFRLCGGSVLSVPPRII